MDLTLLRQLAGDIAALADRYAHPGPRRDMRTTRHVLSVRFGEIDHDDRASLYTLPVRFADYSALKLRMTNAVVDVLFGPTRT